MSGWDLIDPAVVPTCTPGGDSECSRYRRGHLMVLGADSLFREFFLRESRVVYFPLGFDC